MPKPIIVHVLPQNSTICGGIKVHYQLSSIEEELGYTSIIAYPNTSDIPTWFKNGQTVRSYEEAKQYIDGRESIVVGWEDPNSVRSFPATRKVCYIQGEVFVNRVEPYSGIELWYTSHWNEKAVGRPGHYVPPFVDSSVFYPNTKRKLVELPVSVFIQARKAGYERWQQVMQYFPAPLRKRISHTIQEDVSEEEFARFLREADIYFSHSYPEGFGLPALEAMASKTLVVGYTGGGGTDFMENMKNCMYTRDGDAEGIATALLWVITSSPGAITEMAEAGYKTAQCYTRAITSKYLQQALR
jgi:hypothetical protein